MARRKKRQQHIESNKKGKKNNGKENGKKASNGSKSKKTVKQRKGPELEDELYKMGLRVKYMPADGNCFFRSLGDQLYGHDRDHLQIRSAVMDFMEANRCLFELFVEPCLEEDEDFDSYVAQMRNPGHWAGDFEVHAASLCFEVDICIYQIDNESLQCLCNKNPTSRRVIHISYHDNQHYNSVRDKDDYDDAVPRSINMATPESNANHNQNWSWRDEKRIMEDTGCHNDGLIHTYLKECDGNVNEVVERVIEWMRENNYMSEEVKLAEAGETNPLNIDYTASDEDAGETQTPKTSTSSDPVNNGDYEGGNKVLKEDNVANHMKRPSNNKPCPCGSRKPYKRCCKIIEKQRQRQREQREAAVNDCEDASSSANTVASDMTFLFI